MCCSTTKALFLADATGLKYERLLPAQVTVGLIEVSSGVLRHYTGDSLQNTGGLLAPEPNSELQLQGITVPGGAIERSRSMGFSF